MIRRRMRYNGRIMEVVAWIGQNWFVALQSVGIVGSLLFTARSIHLDIRARRLGNLLRLTEQHRAVWQNVLERPELTRVFDANADLDHQPVTEQESLFVTFLLLHLNAAFHAVQERQFATPDGLRADVRWFMRLPIPHEVWARRRPFLDQAFVRFVEDCLDPGGTGVPS